MQAMEESTDWLLRLILNLLGYSTVIVPGALLIYYVKKYNYLERLGPGILKKYLQVFISGNEAEKPSLELGGGETRFSLQPPRSSLRDGLVLVFCFTGLQFFYVTWGILQEKIMTKEYVNMYSHSQKFADSQFLVFVNRVLAFVFAGLYVCIVSQPRHTAPLYKYSFCSFSNIMSSWCQYEALKYINFPTQVLAKASKVLPVMLMGKIVSKKSYEIYEYITALMICAGISMFMLSRKTEMDKGNVTTISGLVILAGYLLFDSFTSNWQGELFTKYRMSSIQMMCGVNLFSCVLTSVSLLQQGGFAHSLSFIILFPEFLVDCIFLSICSAVGQLFIFYTISEFGPVVFVIIMTVRQAIAITVSCILYNHSLSPEGIVGAIVVFGAIFVRIFCSHRKRAARTATNTAKHVSNGQIA